MATGAGAIGAGGGGLSLPMELLGASGTSAGSRAADATEAADGAASFGAVLRGKLAELNTQQAQSNEASQQMATGRVDDIAQTMLRIEQANVSLQMATQVRNKAIEAYQEVLRMQM